MYLIMKTETFTKLFFLISFTGLIMYAILAFYNFHRAYMTITDMEVRGLSNPERFIAKNRYSKDLKYILIWTTPYRNINPFGEGRVSFIYNICPHTNCYITSNKTLLNRDYRNFDAVIFDVQNLRHWKTIQMPRVRNSRQKYVFYGKKSADDAPICALFADKYFNWTWTYKLDSDIVSPFIEVRNLRGEIIAPSTNIEWINDMSDLTSKQVEDLNSKTKAVAWIITNCQTRLHADRLKFVKELQKSLKEHSLVLDIFGCKNLNCPPIGCLKTIEKDYYFYLAYEDSVTEDFVTAEVLKAYNHGAVPIIFGGANYHHFLPEGSYINARFVTAEKLAAVIMYSIRNPTVYQRFFRWRNHYTMHELDATSGICQLCNYLNNESKFSMHSVYEDFRKWWYKGPLHDRCYPKGAEDEDIVLSYINQTNRKRFHS